MESAKRPTMRDIKEQFRMERRSEFLSAALRIVTDENLAALTMARLADELGYSVASLYRYFPSKSALVAEMEREALDIVSTSFRLSQAHLTELLAQRSVDDEADVALTHVVAAIRYWISAERVVSREVDLLRRLFVDPSQIAKDDAERVRPAALRLLDLSGALLDAATASGALDDGSSLHRALALIAGTSGILMTTPVGAWEPGELDGHALAIETACDLLRAWGADPARLARSNELADELEAAGLLVPPVR